MRVPFFLLLGINMTEADSDQEDKELRTLFVGGIHEKVDEETLFELFINVRCFIKF